MAVEQLSGLLRQLGQQLRQNLPANAGLWRITLPVSGHLTDLLLAWLAAQTQFPQFYWCHREGGLEVAVCGAAKQFSHPSQAQAFVHAHPDVRLWGLNAFEGEALLLLPRLEILHCDGKGELTLNLFSEHALEQDAQAALAWLDTLVLAKPIADLQVNVRSSQHQPDRAGWETLLNGALKAIAQQRMDKVVLARCSLLTLEDPLFAPALMAASRRVNHHCYHFMMRIDAHRAFLGSSPERLYLRDGEHLFTEALAGTVARHQDEQQSGILAQWLLQDMKNQQENLLVVDDICQRLQGGVRSVDVLPAEVVPLRKVQHLRRRIEGQLNRCDDADCLQRLQPTAAVAGLPRQAAREFIRQHEPFSRRWYAGSAGYLSAAKAEFCVALRSCQTEGTLVQLYAGAGIVAGSDPAQEWQEIENKAAGLRTLLQPEGYC